MKESIKLRGERRCGDSTVIVPWDHDCVAGDDGANGDHRQTEPSWWLDSLHRTGMNRHHKVRHGTVVRNRRALGDASQHTRGGFVEDKRIDHPKLDAEKDQQDAG